MKIFITIAVLVAASAAAASESFQASVRASAPTHPALYSFADVYRLTVSGVALNGYPLVPVNDSPIRVALTQAAPSPELQFSIAAMPEPKGWLLLLSGLALAVWVVRRRLGYFF